MKYCLPVFLAAHLLLAGCATNPVSGGADFVLLSEEEEIALGLKNHPEILKQYRVYEDRTLQAYVTRIGEGLAKASHRSHIKYTFTVLDSPEVNAFALPGGYIYITRGILAYINSEAELAAVLGHEIGHVTARHGVRQYSRATATSIGLTIATILVPELQTGGAQDLLNIMGNAILSGYGRDAELEADRLGAEYLARTSYEPDAMMDVIAILKNQEEFEKERARAENREPRVYHGVFATHPSADQRLQEVVASARQYKQNSGTPGKINREPYLAQLDGVVFGDSVREGVRRENNFYHLDLGFALSFPQGWRIENNPQSLIAVSPSGDGIMEMRYKAFRKDGERPTPQQYFASELKLSKLKSTQALANTRLPNHSAIARISTPFGKRDARISVVYFGDGAYTLLGTGKSDEALQAYDDAFRATAGGLHALAGHERRLAEGLRIRVVKLDRGARYDTLAKRSPIPNYPERLLRLINNQYPDGEPKPGDRIKLVD